MDYRNRAEREARLASAIAKLGTRQRRQLFEIMGDPPKIENVGAEYWDGAFKEWMGVMTPELESIFVDSALALVESSAVINVDWALANRGAADWARRYGAELVRKIDVATQQGVRDAVADYYEQGWNMGQLRERIGRWFGPQRASAIATTEVTRASVEGEREIVREIGEQGITMVEVWQTSNDELVCPVCGPRHGKAEGDGWTKSDGPPAHTNCRCWTNHELPKREDVGAVGVGMERFERRQAEPQVLEWRPSMNIEQAERWAEGSSFSQPVYHGTTAQSRDGIASDGFDLSRVSNGRIYGDGVYMSATPSDANDYASEVEGGVVMEMRVKLDNVMTFKSDDFRDLIERSESWAAAVGRSDDGMSKILTDYAISKGHDALYIENHQWLVVFDPKKVVVING